jgi:hypothetical protein
MPVPTGFVHRGHLDSIIKATQPLLDPAALHVEYAIGPDSTDVPSIFFRVLLSDDAISNETIVPLTRRISEVLLREVRPLEDWGLRPYFNFRRKSEQDRRRDPDFG